MFDRTTQSQPSQSHSSQSRRKSTFENIDDFDSAEEIFKNKNSFLWTDVSRRNKYKSIFAHENIIKTMKSYFIAWIIIDRKNFECWTTWFETRRMWLNDQMNEIWIDLAHRMRRWKNVKNFDVLEIFMSEKTKKIRQLRN
jgi:hypothetical protein